MSPEHPAGVRMAERDSAFEAQLIQHLKGLRIGIPLHAFATVPSTMDEAHLLASQSAPEGTLVVATQQTQGRGRLGRAWVSPAGGLYLSLILRPRRSLGETPQLSLVAGLATAEAVQERTGLVPMIRWPNDLLVNGAKLAGILVESYSYTSPDHGPSLPAPAVIVGIGINVTTDLRVLPEGAVSLAAAGASCDPNELLAALCRRLEAWYDTWTSHGFDPIRAALRSRLAFVGQPVHVRSAATRLEGILSDVDERGRLLLRLDSGLLRAVEMGEVVLLR